MGEIIDHAAEYETVHRLAKMLGTAKEDYKTTETYALFTAILCWVMQRARTPNHHNDLGDAQAQSVKVQLEEQIISDAPWAVDQLQGMSAFEFFKRLRDAVAHGDNRRIRPLNDNGILKGHSFELRGNNGYQNFTVHLSRTDMGRLGHELAELFCQTMRNAPDNAGIEIQGSDIKEEEPGA